MRRQSVLTPACLAASLVAASAQAGLNVSTLTLGTTWPNPSPDGSTLDTSTETTANPESGTVAQGFNAGGVLSQTFTPTDSITLGALAINCSGSPSDVFSVNIFQMNSTYNPATGTGYVPSTAFASGDLVGGGAGLSFTYNGSAGSILMMEFTGADQIALTAGTTYAFELWYVSGTGNFSWQRASTDTYAGGSMYSASGSGAQSSTSTVVRGDVSGAGTRDSMFTAYAAPAPEPASMAALSLGALALLKKRRK
jgi:hypothetical protein